MLSAVWGLLAFAIGGIWSMFLGIVAGVVVFVVALGLHLGVKA
ncbi:hypothetical protein PTQ19_11930 [Microbacterium esteraromaticum]|nr:hypothetical protein [Microbacterium esteraromaticum]WDH78220.1 hypothetical protein PTQ19_11930 [Microbacterium esteraromaticum]